MSYRSKRTFSTTNEDAPIPQKKQLGPTLSPTQELGASQSAPPLSPSVNKWGPFSPPILKTSQTFGTITQPTKPSITKKKATNNVSSSSKVAQPPSVPTQSTSMQSRSQLNLSKPLSAMSKPSYESLKQKGSMTLNGAPIPPELMAQRKPTQSPMFYKSSLPTTAAPLPYKSSLPTTAAPLPHHETSPLLKSTQPSPLHTTTPSTTKALHKATMPQKKAGCGIVGATKTTTSMPRMDKIQGDNRTKPFESNQYQQNMHSSGNQKKDFAATSQATTLMMSEGTTTLRMDKNPTDHLTLRKPTTSSRHVDYEARQYDSEHSENEEENEEESDMVGNKDTNMNRSTTSKLRRRVLVPNWSDNVKFDEKEEAIAIGEDGKKYVVKGPVHPRDVWTDRGLKYVVHFNDLNQPIRKGGSILVSFINDIAKREKFCPVGVKYWHKLNEKFKRDISIAVREHFVIPTGVIFNKAIWKRAHRSWKHYRYTLKRDYFDPKLSKDRNYENVPDGVSSQNWIALVDHWFSPEGQKLSKLGKDARASIAHRHISGATSFANRRADLEEEKGEFSELDFYKSVYVKKDGSFKEGTLSRQFMEEAHMKVKENLASSSSTSQIEIENKVFNELMYQGEVPKCPLNYGFGVKSSDIFGAQGMLRKEGLNSANNSVAEVEHLKLALSAVQEKNKVLENKNQALENKFDEATQSFKLVAAHLADILKEVRNGNASTEVLDGAEATINVINSQLPDVS